MNLHKQVSLSAEITLAIYDKLCASITHKSIHTKTFLSIARILIQNKAVRVSNALLWSLEKTKPILEAVPVSTEVVSIVLQACSQPLTRLNRALERRAIVRNVDTAIVRTSNTLEEADPMIKGLVEEVNNKLDKYNLCEKAFEDHENTCYAQAAMNKDLKTTIATIGPSFNEKTPGVHGVVERQLVHIVATVDALNSLEKMRAAKQLMNDVKRIKFDEVRNDLFQEVDDDVSRTEKKMKVRARGCEAMS